jgi:FAD/FMN-containing dehydrogenase
LSRPFGLACDNIDSMQLVDAKGQIQTLSSSENTDLFWACRGGGNGSFGIATEFRIHTHSVPQVSVFGMGWQLGMSDAIKVMRAWQDWLPTATKNVTCIMAVRKASSNALDLHVAGQSIGLETELKSELQRLAKLAGIAAHSLSTSTMSFLQAVKHFSGSSDYESIYMKAKSDYVTQASNDQGAGALMQSLLNLPVGAVAALCDSYGGAVNQVAKEATAFVHRAPTIFSIQHYSQWGVGNATPDQIKLITAQHLKSMRDYYASLRPYMSGGCYVNYCDLDLGPGYAEAYWGSNLPRLVGIKMAFDPNNVFNHAQSVPTKL